MSATTSAGNQVTEFLRHASVASDATLLVHSSYRRLGKMLPAEELCASLIAYLDNGTLLMPTMTWRTVNLQSPVFDEQNTPSHTGILSEVFRSGFAQYRSCHPTHSVAAAGKNARRLTGEHHLYPEPCSSKSPYGLIEESGIKDDAFILCIDVGMESCTYFHYFEEKYNRTFFLRDSLESYQLIRPEALPTKVTCFRHTSVNRNFHAFRDFLTPGRDYFIQETEAAVLLLINIKALSSVMHKAFQISDKATFSPVTYLNLMSRLK